MTEKSRELYHCDRCGELFRAPVMSAERVICNLCGHPPVKAIHSKLDHATLGAGEEVLTAQQRQDQADFVGMKRSKRKKRMRFAVMVWLLLLMVGGGAAVYYKTKQEDLAAKRAKQKKVEDYEKLLYYKRQSVAMQQAGFVIDEFVKAPDVNTRSQFVVDGVKILLDMEEYYDTHPPINVVGSLKLHKVRLNEDVESPLLITVWVDDEGKKMEVVFLMQDKRWKIDWSHFVRYSDKSWNRFLLEKKAEESGRFRLYVRERAGRQDDDKDTMHLIFYEPKIFDGGRGVESSEVELNRHTDAGRLIEQALADAKEGEKDEERVLGFFDAPGMARLDVELGFVEEAGEKKLMVRKVLGLDWMTHKN